MLASTGEIFAQRAAVGRASTSGPQQTSQAVTPKHNELAKSSDNEEMRPNPAASTTIGPAK